MSLPADLKRVAQVNAKVYLTDKKQFGNVSYYGTDMVRINVGTTKEPFYIDYSTEDFHSKLLSESIVAKARVTMKDDDSMRVSIKPRVIMQEPVEMTITSTNNTAMIEAPAMTHPSPVVITRFLDGTASPAPAPDLMTGYIDEKSGKFSKVMQPGMIEIKYHKVTRKVELELDSVQLAKLKELGIM